MESTEDSFVCALLKNLLAAFLQPYAFCSIYFSGGSRGIFFKISVNSIEILMVDAPGWKPFKDAILYKILEGKNHSGYIASLALVVKSFAIVPYHLYKIVLLSTQYTEKHLQINSKPQKSIRIFLFLKYFALFNSALPVTSLCKLCTVGWIGTVANG